VTFEFAETNINNQERYMLRSYVPNRLASGEVVGIFVLIRDITERRRTAEALHQAYQHLEQRVRERTAELTALNDQLLREIDERRRWNRACAKPSWRPSRPTCRKPNSSPPSAMTCCNR
jgi:C4-dicarboxylate-specific signal transduction histidine kinase